MRNPFIHVFKRFKVKQGCGTLFNRAAYKYIQQADEQYSVSTISKYDYQGYKV